MEIRGVSGRDGADFDCCWTQAASDNPDPVSPCSPAIGEPSSFKASLRSMRRSGHDPNLPTTGSVATSTSSTGSSRGGRSRTRLGSQSRRRCSYGYDDSRSGPVAVTRTCSSSFTASRAPTGTIRLSTHRTIPVSIVPSYPLSKLSPSAAVGTRCTVRPRGPRTRCCACAAAPSAHGPCRPARER